MGYDTDRMAFKFTMLNIGETVPCEISSAAMDELAGKRGTQPAEREAQFLRLRETIERIAFVPTHRSHARDAGRLRRKIRFRG